MKFKNIIYICALCLGVLACDPELFKVAQAPEVSTIRSSINGFTINQGDTVIFWIEASNPEEGELSYEWSATGGRFIGSTQQSSVAWVAVVGGNYVLKVEVSNDEKSVTKEENIIVPSINPLFVKITKPNNNEFLVQYRMTEILAEASHENGISQINFFVNDNLIDIQQGQASSQYNFDWDTVAPIGEAEIKIEATAITGAKGGDSILVKIEGLLPGKSNGKK
jgi:hypothetical protein